MDSDELAIGVLAALIRAGLRAPDDLSLLGFDDHALAARLGLSTVAQPATLTATEAATLALTLATGETPARRTILGAHRADPAPDDRPALSGCRAMNDSAADQAVLHAAKQQLRAAVRLRRASRSPADRTADDEARFAVLVDALSDRLPDTVAAYLSSDDEPDTLRLISWLRARRVRVLLPLLTDGSGRRLAAPAWAAYAGPEALRLGPLGLLEPTTAPLPARDLPEAELVVCPGWRPTARATGSGGAAAGTTRALVHAGQSAPIVVLLNRDEVLAAIPTQRWDRRVDRLATPDRMIDCEPPYAG